TRGRGTRRSRTGRAASDVAGGGQSPAGPVPRVHNPSSQRSSGMFDLQALYTALDPQRRQRGISWPEVTREVGGVSASPPSGLGARRSVQGVAVLQMLR